MDQNIYAIVMAGGSGKRFWPRSRKENPKQLINIVGKNTMIQDTVERLKSFIPLKNIIIVSNNMYLNKIKKQLPDIPNNNILAEPLSKNTAACIGWACMVVEKRNPNAIICVLPSDHLILDKEKFQQTLSFGCEVAHKKNNIVTIGMIPTRPETGYGYIKIITKIKDQKSKNAFFEVEAFVEKPSKNKAETFLKEGNYFWNSGMFISNNKKMLSELQLHLPNLYKDLLEIKNAIGKKNENSIIKKIYAKLEDVSIDYGVMEKSVGILVIPCKFSWNDLGSWEAIYEISQKDMESNVIVGQYHGIDSTNNYIYSPKKLVTAIGIDDVIIVDTPDALLICKRDRTQDVKKLTDLIDKKYL